MGPMQGAILPFTKSDAAGELSSAARNLSCSAADLDGRRWGLCTRQR
jgi:hypothetical protein